MTAGRADLVVREAPEDALVRSARALRQMGARVARLDPDELTLEARLVRWGLEIVVGVRVLSHGDGATRLGIECGRAGSRPGFAFGLGPLTIARLRARLAAAAAPKAGRG